MGQKRDAGTRGAEQRRDNVAEPVTNCIAELRGPYNVWKSQTIEDTDCPRGLVFEQRKVWDERPSSE